MRTGLVLTILILATSPALAQRAPVSIEGRVVAAENDRPLRRALVSLTTSNRSIRPVLTDDEGRFAIAVPDGSALVVSKAGYATTSITTPRDRQPGNAQRTRRVDVRLSKGVAISGRIVDGKGAGLVSMYVSARRADGTEDERRVILEANTDDRGEYRVGGLTGGRYTVSVGFAAPALITGPGGRGVLEAGPPREREIDVRPGQDVGGIDFTVVSSPSFVPQPLSTGPWRAGPVGILEGRVVAKTGEPVTFAQLRLSGGGQMQMMFTGPRGDFGPVSVREGDYTLEVGKPNVLLTRQVPLFDAPMDTVATHVVRVTAESSRRVEIIVSGGSVVAGEILDEAGEPLQGVEVQALQVRSENGRTVAIRVGAAASRVTDDRGQYRIFGLPSGGYLITAKVNGVPFVAAGARAMAYAPVYYPGTPSVQSAQTLQVPFEAEVNGVNLTVPPSLSARISGKAVDAAGEPLAGLVVRLMPTRRSSAIVIEPFRTPPIGPDGAFEILDVSPGDYVVQAIGAFTFASEYVQVNDGDPPPLTLRGSAGATIEGRFIVEGMAAPPSRALTIHAMPMDTDRAPEKGRGPDGLAVHDDGRFYLTGLRGSMRFSWNSPVAGLYLKSMTIGGIDVTDSPFDFGFEERTISDAEIVLSSAGGRIAGSVTDASGNPATRFVSVAFSTSRQHWYTGSRYVVQRASLADGLFDIDGLPPGEYWVAAVESLAPGDWQTAEALDAIVPAATRVTVAERQTNSTNLRLLRREVSRPPR